MSHIVVHDQIGARKPVRNFVMEWSDGVPCTVRELIAERVRYEHEKAHAPSGAPKGFLRISCPAAENRLPMVP